MKKIQSKPKEWIVEVSLSGQDSQAFKIETTNKTPYCYLELIEKIRKRMFGFADWTPKSEMRIYHRWQGRMKLLPQKTLINNLEKARKQYEGNQYEI